MKYVSGARRKGQAPLLSAKEYTTKGPDDARGGKRLHANVFGIFADCLRILCHPVGFRAGGFALTELPPAAARSALAPVSVDGLRHGNCKIPPRNGKRTCQTRENHV